MDNTSHSTPAGYPNPLAKGKKIGGHKRKWEGKGKEKEREGKNRIKIESPTEKFFRFPV